MSATSRKLILVTALLGQLSACAPMFTPTDPEDAAQFLRVHKTLVNDFELGYVEAGTAGRPMLVFIHGTPGSWHAFEKLLRHPRLQLCCHMIAVDRLGFGKSAGSGVQPDFAVQSYAIAQVFKHNQSNGKVIAVGHSLGGSIAAHLALSYPDEVGGLLVISGALDPELSRPRWYHRLADLPLVRRIIPPDLQLANEEMLVLPEALAAMQLTQLDIPIHIIQGGKDRLVNPRNPAYVERAVNAAHLRVHYFAEDGHFIIWEKPDFIVDQLLQLIATVEPMEPTAVGQETDTLDPERAQ